MSNLLRDAENLNQQLKSWEVRLAKLWAKYCPEEKFTCYYEGTRKQIKNGSIKINYE
jgi:hypothetical protein